MVSSIICTLKQNLKTKHSNVQWNVFKGVYFYWEKSTPQFECAMECLQRSVFLLGITPQFKIELISGEYFFPCGSKFFQGKYYSRSTFFPGNYYSGSNFFRGVIIYGYSGIPRLWTQELDAGLWTLDSGLSRWTLDAGRWILQFGRGLCALDTSVDCFRTKSEASF